MALFLDTHTRSVSRKSSLNAAPLSEDNQVSVIQIFNVDSGEQYCLLDAPNLESVKQFHLQEGVTCDWIEEVTSLDEIEA